MKIKLTSNFSFIITICNASVFADSVTCFSVTIQNWTHVHMSLFLQWLTVSSIQNIVFSPESLCISKFIFPIVVFPHFPWVSCKLLWHNNKIPYLGAITYEIQSVAQVGQSSSMHHMLYLTMEHLWNDTGRGKWKNSEENLFHYHLINHKSRHNSPGLNLRLCDGNTES